jgi:hypothetical protein
MNREGYIRIMKALAHLIIVILQEAGKVPFISAKKVADAFLRATIGKPTDGEQDNNLKEKK